MGKGQSTTEHARRLTQCGTIPDPNVRACSALLAFPHPALRCTLERFNRMQHPAIIQAIRRAGCLATRHLEPIALTQLSSAQVRHSAVLSFA